MSTPKQIKNLAQYPSQFGGEMRMAVQSEAMPEARHITFDTLKWYMQNNLTFPTKTSLGITSFTAGDEEYRFFASVIDFGGGRKMINAQCHIKGDIDIPTQKGNIIPEGLEPQFSAISSESANTYLSVQNNRNITILNNSGVNVILSVSWSTYTTGIASP